MSKETLGIRKLNKEAILPSYSHEHDAGFDICSLEDYTLQPQEFHGFKTGLSSEFAPGNVVLFKPRSGLAIRSGIDVLAGVIDSGYRGEWVVILINHGQKPCEVKAGDRIAQGVLLSAKQVEIVQMDKLSNSQRGEGGLGSTGKE